MWLAGLTKPPSHTHYSNDLIGAALAKPLVTPPLSAWHSYYASSSWDILSYMSHIKKPSLSIKTNFLLLLHQITPVYCLHLHYLGFHILPFLYNWPSPRLIIDLLCSIWQPSVYYKHNPRWPSFSTKTTTCDWAWISLPLTFNDFLCVPD